jgi:hypothetical protein
MLRTEVRQNRHSSWRLYVAVLAAILLALIGLFAGMPAGTALFAAVMIGLLVYVLVDVPPRYRRFGLGQRDQAVDHDQGRFGKTYPEDPVNRSETKAATTTPRAPRSPER